MSRLVESSTCTLINSELPTGSPRTPFAVWIVSVNSLHPNFSSRPNLFCVMPRSLPTAKVCSSSSSMALACVLFFRLALLC